MARAESTPFYGRGQELRRLKELTSKKVASLVVIKGRRRIGKSRLAAEFARQAQGYIALTFQGLPPTEQLTAAQEREDFAQQIHRQLRIPAPRADDWNTLLWTLADQCRSGRYLIVFDEINWLGSKDPTFLGKLKNAWDGELSKNPKIILIFSGSLTGWIERNILHHTGFLGRVSLDFTLSELPIENCDYFWRKHRNRIASYEKLRVFAVTGGVPRYLEEVDPALSADANIHRLCFSREGLLFNEFDRIFDDLFSTRNQIYRRLVAALVDGPLDFSGLHAALGISKTGKLSEYVNDLVLAGFISRDYSWELKTGTTSKLSTTRLSDNYLRFYLKFIQPRRRQIERGTLEKLPNLDSILGLQFENLVLNNRESIFRRLRIDPNDVLADNPYIQSKTLRHEGCQIDYLIQTRQNILYVCEIKFSKNTIPTTVVAEMRRKVERIQFPRNMSFQPVLIHAGSSTDAITDQEYFSTVIDIGELFSAH